MDIETTFFFFSWVSQMGVLMGVKNVFFRHVGFFRCSCQISFSLFNGGGVSRLHSVEGNALAGHLLLWGVLAVVELGQLDVVGVKGRRLRRGAPPRLEVMERL